MTIFNYCIEEVMLLVEKKSKKIQNSKKDYEEALASEDPTVISNQNLEDLAKEAVKKFKAL